LLILIFIVDKYSDDYSGMDFSWENLLL